MIMICILLIVLVAGIDLICKWYVDSKFKIGETLTCCKEKITVRKVHNKGMMLNVLEKRPEIVKTGSFIALVMALMYQMFLFTTQGRLREKIGVALNSGGALSNTFDRIKRGYVVDYIGFNFKWKKAANVTYNLGDFAIFAGTILVLIENLKKK